MQEYRSNKIKTAFDMIRGISNWPTAVLMRLRKRRPGLRLLSFRNGLNIVCRGGTRDWDVIHELIFARGYGRAFEYLRRQQGRTLVLDLGGNIGLFSLMAASQQSEVFVHAYEPGPPNFRLFEMNRLGNYPLSERICLHCEAVGGETRSTKWFFDEKNPAGSSLFGSVGTSFEVRISAFKDIVASMDDPVALVKIDIEGAEFELLERTPAETWRRVSAISLELHDDPAGKISPDDFLRRICSYGFAAKEEKVCSYFLERR